MNYVVGVTTTRPSSALTPGGGGGCLTLLDPKTGVILSSLRSSADLAGKAGLGVSSLSLFPASFSASNSGAQPAIAYGGNSVKKGDNNAMLISIRSATASPILHWRCRLPETEMTAGLIVSPCGYYIVGGGASGSCYIWSSVSLSGRLLRTFKAHYRSCTCMTFSDCGKYLATGSADGMVHLFSLMDLVDMTSPNSKRNVSPMHTFSIHHFPVTSLIRLPSGRMASAAEDGQVIVVELFSQLVLLNIQLPHGIKCMAHYDGRLFLGSIQGTIYSVDTNAYAMHQTEKQGAIFAKRRRQEQQNGLTTTIEETVFGMKSSNETSNAVNNTGVAYQTDWVGHDHPVTSVALLTQGNQKLMISGDELGQVRIWDLESRTCLNVLQPWSHGSTLGNKKPSDPVSNKSSTVTTHPITSISIISQPADTVTSGMFQASAGSSKKLSSISSLIPPLQKFQVDTTSEKESGPTLTKVPFLKKNRSAQSIEYWQARPIHRKRRRGQGQQAIEDVVAGDSSETTAAVTNNSEENPQILELTEQIKNLQDQLKAKQSEIDRWEKVNNKLMAKLQSK
eukprot:CAMPEP_0178750210 /NCGR_PEP_ID=MMETSP0744-20121128/9841_1 /TAXON_ID=913974 /ORGANISM="Nitzschia punctata, Strain CCMP561" /LENGTH=563 /DNA_ID=CAMNT_0020403713 /DNA_START=183 /DNA_END=1874 /DNA_ORIENTATION=-